MGIFTGIKRLVGLGEKRVHPSQSTNWSLYGITGRSYDTASGANVNEDTAQGVTAVYACIRVISETVSSLPFHLYQKINDNQRKRAVDHPLYPIVNRKPNPDMTDIVFRETLMVHLLTWGNFYGLIDTEGGGQPKAIWPLRPDRVSVERWPDKERRGLYYTYRSETGREFVFTSDEILHIPGLGFDGIMGYSPIEKNREAIGLSMGAEQYGSRFFKNDARPGVVLKHPGELSDPAQERLRKNWEKIHMGSDNAHRLAILEEGMDITTIGIPPQDAQWIELRNFQLPEICRIYGVPPPLIGDLSRATFSNVTELNEHFGKYCIGPWLKRIEQGYNDKLLKEAEKDTYYTEHLMDALLRSDTKSRYETYASGRQWGIFSANDIRRMENMDAIEGGDVYLSPSNMVPSDMVGKVPPAGTDWTKGGLGGKDNGRDGLHAVFEPLIRASVQKIVNREVIAISKVTTRTDEEIGAFLNELYGEKLPDYIREHLGPIMKAYFQALGLRDFVNVDDYIKRFIGDYISTSRTRLEDVIQESNGGERKTPLVKCLNEWKAGKVDSELEHALTLGRGDGTKIAINDNRQ